MTLVDTSVWIDFLRRPGHPGNEPLRELLRHEEAVTTPPIEMELLLGPTDELSLRRVEKAIVGVGTLPVQPDVDFHDAAAIYRAVRRSGRTVRNSVDCLIAAIAIRHEVPLLHRDADFEAIAGVTELQHRSLL
ncbi:type II toxin-antitoxin system toxin ribonuclease VapC11 [Nocardioides humi]|uniref:Ribonuclease VapC n=1 Tax=Nocardioides humi TaxID=449461 RepID=A0ABN2A0M1_9ACTN